MDADGIKPGQAQLISQAWQKHQRAQQLISAGDIHAVLEAQWLQEMESNLNECFITSMTFARPKGVFVSEIFTTVQRVIKEAAKKGHSVGSALSRESGWDFLKTADRKAAKLLAWWLRKNGRISWSSHSLVDLGLP